MVSLFVETLELKVERSKVRLCPFLLLNYRLYHFVLCDGWTNCFGSNRDQTGTLANHTKCTQLNSTSQNSF